MNIGELFIQLGFKADTMKLKDFTRSLAELNMTSIMSTLGVGALYEATSKIMNIADKAAMSIFGFEQSTGISGKTMQQFSNYAEQMGASSEDAEQSLKNLQMSMLQMRLGRGNAEPFILMGIDPAKSKSVVDVLVQVQKFLKTHLTDSKETQGALNRMLISELGISESMIQVLKNSRDIREDMEKQVYVVDKQVSVLLEYNKQVSALRQHWRILYPEAATAISSVVDGLLKIGIAIGDILHSSPKLTIALSAAGYALLVFLNPALAIVLAIVVGLGLLASKWESVSKAIEKFYNKTLKPIVEPVSSFMKGVASHIPNMGPDSLGAWLGNAKTPALSTVGAGNTVSNNIDVNVSGVSDPEKASDLVVKKIRDMLTDTYYHRKTQER